MEIIEIDSLWSRYSSLLVINFTITGAGSRGKYKTHKQDPTRGEFRTTYTWSTSSYSVPLGFLQPVILQKSSDEPKRVECDKPIFRAGANGTADMIGRCSKMRTVIQVTGASSTLANWVLLCQMWAQNLRTEKFLLCLASLDINWWTGR